MLVPLSAPPQDPPSLHSCSIAQSCTKQIALTFTCRCSTSAHRGTTAVHTGPSTAHDARPQHATLVFARYSLIPFPQNVTHTCVSYALMNFHMLFHCTAAYRRRVPTHVPARPGRSLRASTRRSDGRAETAESRGGGQKPLPRCCRTRQSAGRTRRRCAGAARRSRGWARPPRGRTGCPASARGVAGKYSPRPDPPKSPMESESVGGGWCFGSESN